MTSQWPAALPSYSPTDHDAIGGTPQRPLIILNAPEDLVGYDNDSVVISDECNEFNDEGSSWDDEDLTVSEVCYGVVSTLRYGFLLRLM